MEVCVKASSNNVEQYEDMLKNFNPVFGKQKYTNYAVIELNDLSDLSKLSEECEPFTLMVKQKYSSQYDLNLEFYDDYLE